MFQFLQNLFTSKRITDFKKWVSNCSEKELAKFVKKIEEGIEYDYTIMHWGHAFSYSRTYGKYVHYGSGFYGALIGCSRPKMGSVLLLKTGEGKIGRFLILNIDWVRDPKDMFWVYLIGVGYKENN